VLKNIQDLNPIEAYNAYVEEAINEKLLISKEINKDPHATIENKENNPKLSKLA
jgi:hypothetical protein